MDIDMDKDVDIDKDADLDEDAAWDMPLYGTLHVNRVG